MEFSVLNLRLFSDLTRSSLESEIVPVEFFFSDYDRTKVHHYLETRTFTRHPRTRRTISGLRYISHDLVSDSYLKFLSNVLENRVSG
jgi:hypothetical protein